jgi:hypothetical protein
MDLDNFIINDDELMTLNTDMSTDTSNKKCNYSWLIIIIVVAVIIYFWWNLFYNDCAGTKNQTNKTNNENLEHMSAGTLTQMFAVDAQNKALNGDVNELATGNYNLYWGQPSRVASTYPNRGQLLPATMISRVAAEQNGNNPNNLDINLNYDQTYSQQLDQKVNKLVNYLDSTGNGKNKDNSNQFLQQNCGENCYTNPQACGNGAGGYRLGSDFVEPSTAKPFVSLQGNLYMPDQYVGSYWIAPEPDIMKPLPVVANGMYPLNNNFNSN